MIQSKAFAFQKEKNGARKESPYQTQQFSNSKNTGKMANQFSKDQAVKVLCYNFKTKKNEWQDATVLDTIPATDRPFRIELRLSSGIELKGYDAAAPECVKPTQN